MNMTPTIQKILSHYESDTPGTKTSLVRLLSAGITGGTGRLVILPVDQGFEHGPDRSFAANPVAYDPHSHFRLAINGGASAFAAPLGLLEAGADTFVGQIPLIMKMNSSNTLPKLEAPDQAITGSVKEAIRLGCVGIGFTIYPGSAAFLNQQEEIRGLIEEAKSHGLFAVIWSYPRGNFSSAGEQGIDVVAYGAHMACLMGAHVVKVKLPTAHLEKKDIAKAYKENNIPISTLAERVAHIRKACFEGRRLVVFSGGPAQKTEDVLEEARSILAGGGNGSIIGRNSFQRPAEEGASLLKAIGQVYTQG